MAMFSEKKSFWKGKWFYIAIAALLGFGYWVNSTIDWNAEEGDPGAEANVQQTIKDNDKSADKSPVNDSRYSPESNGGFNDVDEDENEALDQGQREGNRVGAEDGQEPETGSCYVVREDDGLINLYYRDENGNEAFLEETDIAFDLLSETDQDLFRNGIVTVSYTHLDVYKRQMP